MVGKVIFMQSGRRLLLWMRDCRDLNKDGDIQTVPQVGERLKNCINL